MFQTPLSFNIFFENSLLESLFSTIYFTAALVKMTVILLLCSFPRIQQIKRKLCLHCSVIWTACLCSLLIGVRICVRFGLSPLSCPNMNQIRTNFTTLSSFLSEYVRDSDNPYYFLLFPVRIGSGFGQSLLLSPLSCPNMCAIRTIPTTFSSFLSE